MNNHSIASLQLLFTAFVGIFLSACGGGGTATTGPTGAAANTDFLIRYMKENYLWNDRVPATASFEQFSDQDAALKALRVTEDKFSNIASEADYNSFNQAGQLTGYGISYKKLEALAVLQQVFPQSPAYAAGLRRGDEILALDGKNLSEFATPEAFSTALGTSTAGIKGTFLVQTPLEGGTGYAPSRNLSITKATYPVTYVFAANTQMSSAGKVGYIHFYSFTGSDLSAWGTALNQVISEGAQHLIVDLRDNGGGLISDAVAVASVMGPKGSALPAADSLTGKVAVTLEHNAQKRALDTSYRFGSSSQDGRFDQIVIITSAKTCSASEIVLNSLKPFRTVKTIGATTCGKPYGFAPPTFNGFVYSIVNFQSKNANGEGGYVNGLAPTCELPDPYLRNLGDPQERLFAGALKLIETGTCPDAALLPKGLNPVTSSQARQALLDRAPGPFWRGIEHLTGVQ